MSLQTHYLQFVKYEPDGTPAGEYIAQHNDLAKKYQRFSTFLYYLPVHCLFTAVRTQLIFIVFNIL